MLARVRGVAVLLAVVLVAAMCVVVESPPAGAAGCTQSDTYGAAVCADGPLGYWRLRDTTTTATDSSGNGYNGTANANGQATAPLTFGVSGPIVGDSSSKAWQWPVPASSCTGVDLPSSFANASSSSALTVEMWAWFNSQQGGVGSLAMFSNNALGMELAGIWGTPGQQAQVSNQFPVRIPNTTSSASGAVGWGAPNNSWHLIDAVRLPAGGGGGVWVVYADGIPVGLSASYPLGGSGNGLPSPIAASIGKDVPPTIACGSSDFGWSGAIAEVAFYNSALTPARIGAHYVASGRTLPASLAASELYGGGNLLERCVQCYLSSVESFTKHPVDASTGNFWHTFDDLSIPGRGPAIDLTQTYNSLAASVDGLNGPLGWGWSFSYGMSLSFGSGSPPSSVTVHQENGAQATFTLSGGSYTAPSRVQGTLTHNGDGTWTLVRQAREIFAFDSSGKLTSIKDLNGYTTTLAYSSGKLSSVTDPAGRVITFGFTGSLITTVTDTAASPHRTVQLGYDANNNLTSITDVGGGVTTMSYDSSHRMTQMLDPNQQSASTKHYLTNHYDANGRVDWQSDWQDDANGKKTTFSYATGSTTVTDPQGNVTVESFLGSLPISLGKGGCAPNCSATWTNTFDPATLMPTGVADPNGHTISMTYDGQGNVLSRTEGIDGANPPNPPTGTAPARVTYYTYNAYNQVTTIKDPLGAVTTIGYDTAHSLPWNVVSSSTPIGGQTQSTTFAYGDSSHPGDVTSMTDPNLKVWQYAYDSAGDLTQVTDPVTPTADVTKYCYDSIGRRLETLSPQAVVAGTTCSTNGSFLPQVYTYNAFGDLLTATDANGKQAINTYDADRNLQTAKDPDGNQTSYAYDLDNRLTQITRPDTTTLKNAYFYDGTLKSQTDGNNKTTSYAYDALAHLTGVTDPLNRTTSYTNDALGNVLTKLDPVTGATCTGTKVGCTTYGYDTTNELTSISYSDGVTPNVSYSYDLDGQRVSMTDGTGTTNWTWDALHRVTQKADPGSNCGASPRVNCTTYGYDLKNQLTSIGYPGQTTSVAQTFDEAGRLKTVTDWNTKTTTFGYDPNSNLNTVAFPTSSLTDAYTYNHADQITAWALTNGASTLASLSYGRDNNGQQNSVTQNSATPGLPTGPGTPNQGSSETYNYNSLNQLTKRNGATTWTYDNAGNLTQIPTATGSNQQGFDTANELCYVVGTGSGSCTPPPSGATTVGYDSRGNRTTSTLSGAAIPTSYAYDQANRLTSVTSPVAGNQGGYKALPPARILDTRSCTSPCGHMAAWTTLTIPVAGQGGVPTSGASSVVVNVTALNESAAGYLTLYASTDTPPLPPLTSNVDFSAGQLISGLAIVKLGTDGKITIYAGASDADVIVDVQGYYDNTTGPAGSYFNPVSPSRILDTRYGTGTCTPSCSTIPAWNAISVQAGGTGGVPPTGATAVAVNVTVVNPPAAGYLTLWAATDTQPSTSNLNYNAGNILSELVVVKLGTGTNGMISIYSGASNADVVVDVQGWYGSTGTNAFNTVPPVRVLDTRTCLSPCGRLGAGATLDVQIGGQNNIPTNATVAVVNLTVVNPTAAGYLTAYQTGTTRPTTSNVNFTAGQVLANMAFVPLGTGTNAGKITLYAGISDTDVLVDIVGYDAPATTTSSYAYNGDGLRTAKTPPGATAATTYTWSTGQLPLLLRETTNNATTYYLYGPGAAPIEQINPDGTTSWLHHDQLGSIRVQTDANAAVSGTASYDPYGLRTTNSTTTTPFGYTGQYTDTETGLQYLRNRYYDPTTGQFLTRDPLTPLTRDPYGYAANSPLNYTDPTGLLFGLSTDDTIMGGALLTAGVGIGCVALWEACLGAIGTNPTVLYALLGITGAGFLSEQDAATLQQCQATEEGMAGVRAAGAEGEAASGILKNTDRIPSLSGSAAYRIPDELGNGVLGEVKNVSSLSYTSQLRDFTAYAQQQGLQFNLYVRGSTVLSGPLQEAVDNGTINLIRNLPG
jgi:RHS repeat-associated protein